MTENSRCVASTPYTVDNYVITEEATLWCETAYISQPTDLGSSGIPNSGGTRSLIAQTDTAGIESAINKGARLGTLDVAGLTASIFNTGR